MAGVGVKQLDTGDVVVVVIYFLVLVAASVFAMCTSKRDTTSGYFLAGRFITFIPIGASLFASCVGSEHFIGLAGSGAATGLGVAAFEVFAVFALLVLGWLFLPVYLASGVYTLPEYIGKRFGGRRIQSYLAVLSLVLYILTKVSVTLFSAEIFINAALHWNFAESILLILAITMVCTVCGGLTAVIYTDTVQAFLMCAGSLVLAIFSFREVGGIDGLFEKYMNATPSDRPPNSTCGVPPHNSLRMLRDPADSDLPWPGFIFGSSMISIWYWCADQVIVQRALAAKNLSHGQGGTIVAGYIKLLPLFLIVMPGMVSRVLYTDDIACSTPEVCKQVCGNEAGCSNLAYPWLIMNLLPSGLRGLMVAVMLAAMVSNLTSIFNSTSSIFTMDLYPLLRKNPSNREQMIVSRFFVVLMTIMSILWIPIVQGTEGGQLFIYLQAVQAFLAPPIAVVFLIGVLWSRATEQGAFWSLILGFITGTIRLIMEFAYKLPQCGEVDSRPAALANVNYLYFAILLAVQTAVVMIILSVATQPTPGWRIIRTVYWHRFDETIREDELPPKVAEYLEANPSLTHEVAESSLTDQPSKQSYQATEGDDDSDKSDHRRSSLGEPFSRDMEEDSSRLSQIGGWLRTIVNWLCGFSLIGSDEKPTTDGEQESHEKFDDISDPDTKDKRARRLEDEARTRVQQMVKSISQKVSTRFMLMVNSLIILAIMIFIALFFSIPSRFNSVQ